ncbi:MAG: hypothetical protein FJX35_20055 [Alphaproteobacteria bacterium]|nr:hypothetical protein [Alphaproteobacteria bacterium]
MTVVSCGSGIEIRCLEQQIDTSSTWGKALFQCSFSWNRDPATGLICIESGPLGDGSKLASWVLGALTGMLVVETIAKICRAYFSQGKPIKEICRELRVYCARFFGHKFGLSGVLHGVFLPGDTRLTRAA